MSVVNRARRELLRFFAASPVFAAASLNEVLAQTGSDILPPLSEALNVFDFEPVARQRLSRAHWAYLATGVDDEVTLKANRVGFEHYDLRVRRMVDISAVDTSVNLFGTNFDSPIVLAPVSSQGAFSPDGELASARAAKAGNHLQILSTLTSAKYEDVNAARGGGVWFQLYATDHWDVTAALLKRARVGGAEVLVVTTDLNGGSNRETFSRASSGTSLDCRRCHPTTPMDIARLQYKAMFSGIDVTQVNSVSPSAMTWDTLKSLRDHWPGKLLLKGIVTREDAELCVRHGVDGIYVSNHGGRAEESGRATIDSLGEVIAGANKRVPVIVDSGFRRGTDILKALALGASAVAVGRPYIWGLAAYGEPGVRAVLGILRRELSTAMRQAGAHNIAAITSAAVIRSTGR